MGADGRRRFLIGAGALLAAPALARAQGRVRRVAWLGTGASGSSSSSPFFDALREGLREHGWDEGRNLTLTPFWTQGTMADAEPVARQAVASNPELIIVHGRDVPVLHRLRPPMPVVFGFSGNPIDAGIVQSFARPGGNFTGLSFMSLELVAKRLELLRETAPAVRRLAVIARPEHAGEPRERAASEEAAARLGLAVAYIPVQQASGLEDALQTVTRERCDALVAFPDAVTLASSPRIASFAIAGKIATVSGWSGFADNGFLMTFGPNLRASYRALARYVDRVLRGAKPEDLPVELPRTVELVLNARTARALGITIPDAVRLRADRVID